MICSEILSKCRTYRYVGTEWNARIAAAGPATPETMRCLDALSAIAALPNPTNVNLR